MTLNKLPIVGEAYKNKADRHDYEILSINEDSMIEVFGFDQLLRLREFWAYYEELTTTN
jgi:hypothetical protein